MSDPGFWMEPPYSGPRDPRYWDWPEPTDDDLDLESLEENAPDDDEFYTGIGSEPYDMEVG